ncbi:unnamed protein product [Brassica rapa]|uniref:Uncharacterized protein n=1 Tax=Brassica campestris TaxID=3711 RepID=A0A8D9DLE7_BRACM|nr:unnamed protein product [Brassica rapa]
MHTDSHGRPVCAGGHPQTQPTWAKIIRIVHGKGQRAESKDQRADICTDGQPRTSYTHGHTRTATDILCVLTYSHVRPVCADVHTRTSSRAESKDQRADMCTDGQPL